MRYGTPSLLIKNTAIRTAIIANATDPSTLRMSGTPRALKFPTGALYIICMAGVGRRALSHLDILHLQYILYISTFLVGDV